ncbi:MAG: hypothetical protein KQA34_02930, partial [Candidatus Aenigmarchaeota archaeon]|nr:hypothetical protein [Candidatus Aenigmarchaeota archaeon]
DKNSYQGKKYENLLKKLSVVLSMFYETEKLFEPDSDLVFDFDLEYFKKEILFKKTKNNEKFISELSAKLDSVINKLKENSKN